MEHYFVVNSLVSFAIIALITRGQGASRPNYWLTWLGMAVWFIPYPLITQWLSSKHLVEPVILSSEVSLSVSQAIQVIPRTVEFERWLSLAFGLVLAIGLFIFTRHWLASYLWQRLILTSGSTQLVDSMSERYQLPVYRSDKISSGMLVGLFSPKILIADALLKQNEQALVELVILHEKTHLARKDNYRLLLLSLIVSLFWWNPLVQKLARLNKFYMEVRCDEITSTHFDKANGNHAYQKGLAQLVLNSTNSSPYAVFSSVLATKNENVARIKRLTQTRKTTMKTKLTYALTMLVAFTAITWTSMASVTSTGAEHTREQADVLGAQVEFNITVNDRSDPDHKSEYRNQVILWTHFDKQSSIEVSENFAFRYRIEDQGELAKLDLTIVEAFGNEKIVANPRITVAFGEEGMIELDNPAFSKHGYQIKVVSIKSAKPVLN